MSTQMKDLQPLAIKAPLRLVVTCIGALCLIVAFQGRVDGGQALELSCPETPGATLWTAHGPAGSEFVIRASGDLKVWTPVFSDRFGAGPCQFIDPVRAGFVRRFYRSELGSPTLSLDNPAVTNAAPFSLLPLKVAGLDLAAGDIYARFFDEHGYTAEVPAIAVSSSEVTFPVPPYLVARSEEAAAGTVDLQVIQRTAGMETISRTIRGFSIDDLPRSDHPPGAVAVHFLEGAVEHAQMLLGELQGTPFDTPDMREALTRYTVRTTDFLEVLREAVRTPSSPVLLGYMAGQRLMLDGRVLENLDRLVLGLLHAQSGAVPAVGLARVGAQFKTGNCARAEAQTYGNALLHNPDTAGVARSGYYGAYGRCTAGAFGTAYKVVGGAGGVALSLAVLAGLPAEALALATGALLYITAQGAGSLVALSGALGQESTGAAQMLQTGVDMIEDLLRGPAKSALNETTGAVLDLVTSAASLKEAFAVTALEPAPTTGVRPETIQMGSVGGCAGGTLSGSIQVFAPDGVTWTVESMDQLEDPTVEVSSTNGTGAGTVSFRLVGAPQAPTPGFSCEDIGFLHFTHVFDFTFANGAFVSVLVEYQYLLVL